MKIEILMNDWYGWKEYSVDEYIIWVKGYFLNNTHEYVLNSFATIISKSDKKLDELIDFCNTIRGHFAIIIYNKNQLFVMADKVRSIPLFYKYVNNKITVSNHSPILAKNINDKKYSPTAVIEISMSGYTIGKKTILSDIYQMNAGEFLLLSNKKIKTIRYYYYTPWKEKYISKEACKKELTKVSKSILLDMVNSAKGRQIVVLLSAGHDSRFIVSGLKELNVKNVVCFSYGDKDSFEVKIAKQIADKLSYKWIHIPLSIPIQKKSFLESVFDNYCDFSDSLSNSPIVMDYTAIKAIKYLNIIDSNAVFVNGNSGDFITGGHIFDFEHNNSNDSGVEAVLDRIIEKHYSLWECLKTEKNISNIRESLKESLIEIMNTFKLSDKDLWAVSESMEWLGRQSKFVTATQRSYEFFGYDWRPPMWDPMYCSGLTNLDTKIALYPSRGY